MVQTELTPQVIDSQEIQKTNEILKNTEDYQSRLKKLPEVQALTTELDLQDVNTVVTFGQKSAESISTISDKIFNIVKVPTNKDAAEMMTKLANVMNKFDIKELEKIQAEPTKQGLFQKLKQKIVNELEALISKYDNIGKEVDSISQLLRTYENQTKQDNVTLTELCIANQKYFEELERYIAAADLGLNQIAVHREEVVNRTDISEDQKNAHLQQVDMMSQMLVQRQYDLLQAETVARMTVPMLQNMQLTNVNLIREINSAFVVGLPIFKQNLAQAILLKRQAITANSMDQFRTAVNTQLAQNAQYVSAQGKVIAESATKGTFDMKTLRQVYETIKKGTQSAQEIMQKQLKENQEHTKELENMKSEIKSGSLTVIQAPTV